MLRAQDRKLAASLDEARSSFRHSGLRGDVTESALREFLSDHLPRQYTVGTGEVIDLHDGTSSQTDVVVANMDQPFRSGLHDSGLFLVEGVAAAGEIKSRLTKTDLSDTLVKAAKFKSLRNHHGVGDSRHTNPSDGRRFYESPPYFLFAYESVVATETLLGELCGAELVPGPAGAEPLLHPLDGVFVLGRGVAINYGDGQGSLQWHMPTEGGTISVPGWVWHDTDTVIAQFLIWLSGVVPTTRRVSPIAIEYLLRHMAMLRASGGQVRGGRDESLSQVYRD
ncbi:DUF6602 domain-containing protein [Streptomyces goshikiensis]|uniref:DUF6602 domain-containing protein n=1 Tax=Streptomyces goshikiensis TaxID=1942 RepID=UPI00371DEBAF